MLSSMRVRVNWLELCEATGNVWFDPGLEPGSTADTSSVLIKDCTKINAPMRVGKSDDNRWTFS